MKTDSDQIRIEYLPYISVTFFRKALLILKKINRLEFPLIKNTLNQFSLKLVTVL